MRRVIITTFCDIFIFQQKQLLQKTKRNQPLNLTNKFSIYQANHGKSENQMLTLSETITSLVGTRVLKSPANEAPLAKNGLTFPWFNASILATFLSRSPLKAAYSKAFFLAASQAAFLACLTPKVRSDWSKVTPLTSSPSILAAASMSRPMAAPSAVMSRILTDSVWLAFCPTSTFSLLRYSYTCESRSEEVEQSFLATPWAARMRSSSSILRLRVCRAAEVVFYWASAPMSMVAKSGFTFTSALPDTLMVFTSQHSVQTDTSKIANSTIFLQFIQFLLYSVFSSNRVINLKSLTYFSDLAPKPCQNWLFPLAYLSKSKQRIRMMLF